MKRYNIVNRYRKNYLFMKKLSKKQIITLAFNIFQIVLMVLLLVISINVLICVSNKQETFNNTGWTAFIVWLYYGNASSQVWRFFVIIVLPLIILFLYNGWNLFKAIVAAKDETKTGKLSVEDKQAILDQAKKEAREEMLKEMAAEKEKPAVEEKKEDKKE